MQNKHFKRDERYKLNINNYLNNNCYELRVITTILVVLGIITWSNIDFYDVCSRS